MFLKHLRMKHSVRNKWEGRRRREGDFVRARREEIMQTAECPQEKDEKENKKKEHG